jgi:phage terminase large subunit-like protein
MHAALERFVMDLQTKALTHDDCKITANHIGNARMFARSGQTYIILKPSQTQKIDAAVTSVIAHEAACDARADGWSEAFRQPKGVSNAVYGFN